VIRLAVRVPRSRAELVLAELAVLAPAGFEEREVGDLVEYAIYGAAGELPDLGELRALVGDALVDVVTTEVPDDWEERWRHWHRPLDVGPLRVRPPWEPGRPGALDIVIDPGQAFGTGAHATTRLCLEALGELDARGPLVDLGCGSGVLAIAAARLGWTPVLGLDHETVSVAATAENARANAVEVVVRRFDLRHEPVPAAPTVVANLLRPLLEALRFEQPPRTLVASGLLAHEEVALPGLRVARRLERDGWQALVYQAE